MEMSRRTALGAAATAGAAIALSRAAAAAQPPALALPSTPIAAAAQRLIDTALTAPVRNHSIRGFLFGRALAETQGLRPGADYDEELMYLICALHDIGLGDIANGHQRFEVDGADYAAEFLERNGLTDGRVDMVWDAIAAHTSGFSDSPVYRRRRPPPSGSRWTASGSTSAAAPPTCHPATPIRCTRSTPGSAVPAPSPTSSKPRPWPTRARPCPAPCPARSCISATPAFPT